MRWAARVLAWVAVGLVIALVSAVVSAVLLRPVHRETQGDVPAPEPGAVAAPAAAPAPPAIAAPAPAASPASAPAPALAPAPGTPLAAAREFIDQLAAADLRRAQALFAAGAGPDERQLVEWATLDPVPDAAAALPGGNAAATEVLVWVDYRRGYQPLRGFFRIVLLQADDGWRVTTVTGPVAPRGGYLPFPYPATALSGQPVLADARRGPLVLWAPREAEPGLVGQMEALRRRYEGRIQVILALDLAAPAGWDRLALQQGWLGPVWRVKGELERLPLTGLWPYGGAFGVLVDRRGLVVAPLGVLDPTRYGIDPARWAEVADNVLAAYHLTSGAGGG